MDIFKHAKEVLDGVKKAEQAALREQLQKCSWDDPSDVAQYLAGKRLEERRQLIEKLAPNHVCPMCKTRIFSARSWVISTDKKNICCRSCFHLSGQEIKTGVVEDRNIFGALHVKIEIRGYQLASIREALGIKLTMFARKAGWSTVYQHKLENTIQIVPIETAEVVLRTLQEYGCLTKDCL